jgi:hypothetical protein
MNPNRQLVQIRASTMDSDSTMAAGELDLGPYVNAGKRMITGVWAPFPTTAAATDTDTTLDNKFQESATTVDSDFSDISGAAFTQVLQTTTLAFQTVNFSTNKRYIRSVITIGGTAGSLVDHTAVLVGPRFDT